MKLNILKQIDSIKYQSAISYIVSNSAHRVKFILCVKYYRVLISPYSSFDNMINNRFSYYQKSGIQVSVM